MPTNVEDIPETLSELVQRLIELGDDADRPRGSTSPRHRTRSKSVFSAACALARAGCAVEVIAGVLINPHYGISKSILDGTKKDPIKYALRQAVSAVNAVRWLRARRDRSGAARLHEKEGKFALLDRQMQVVNICSSATSWRRRFSSGWRLRPFGANGSPRATGRRIGKLLVRPLSRPVERGCLYAGARARAWRLAGRR